MTLAMMVVLLLGLHETQPNGWQCLNDLEVSCNAEQCEAAAADEFTPMRIFVEESGAMSVCAYSGCWEGRGELVRNGYFMIWTGQDLKFSTSPDSEDAGESIALVLDRRDHIGVLKAGAFAHPVHCEAVGDSTGNGKTSAEE